jgi:hypothetical protein
MRIRRYLWAQSSITLKLSRSSQWKQEQSSNQRSPVCSFQLPLLLFVPKSDFLLKPTFNFVRYYVNKNIEPSSMQSSLLFKLQAASHHPCRKMSQQEGASACLPLFPCEIQPLLFVVTVVECTKF